MIFSFFFWCFHWVHIQNLLLYRHEQADIRKMSLILNTKYHMLTFNGVISEIQLRCDSIGGVGFEWRNIICCWNEDFCHFGCLSCKGFHLLNSRCTGSAVEQVWISCCAVRQEILFRRWNRKHRKQDKLKPKMSRQSWAFCKKTFLWGIWDTYLLIKVWQDQLLK